MKVIWMIMGLLCLFTYRASAQDTRINLSGRVMDIHDEALEGVAVLLKKAVDSTFVTGGSTDSSGVFTFLDAKPESYIFVKTEKLLKKIYLKDILFIESLENYVVFYTSFSKDTVSIRLKNLLDALPGKTFMQVHRSFIVNLSCVQAIEGNQLIIEKHKIPVSRPLREEVYAAIINNQLISK